MKTALILLLIAICGFAWQSESIMHTLGLEMSHADKLTTLSIDALTSADSSKVQGMSVHEYAELTKKDPHARQAYRASLTTIRQQKSRVSDRLVEDKPRSLDE